MEIDQVYKAPSIPKLNRRNIKSTLIGGAIKPGVELKKSKFSFIKPLVKLIPDSLVPIKDDENKGSLVKNIQSGAGIQKLLEQSNKILSQIKEQLSLDFLSRINQEKKELAENKKRIAAEKVKDKEKKIETGGRGLLGKTLSAVVAPAKNIFQKLLDFFSIILTGILVNSAFKWLQKPENQKKLQDFFNFLKEYWQELLIVFGAVKLLGLIRKIQKTANAIKSLIDFFKSNKTKLPCNCPKSPAQNIDDCLPLKDCIDSLVKNPRRNGPMLEALASLIIATSAFEPVRKLLNQKGLPVPPVPAPAAAAPPPQATTAKQAVQQNQATPSPQLAASNAIKQQKIPKNLQPVVQKLVNQYYQSGYTPQRITTQGGSEITVEATNSTGVFTQRNYNPKITFNQGIVNRRQQTLDSPWTKAFGVLLSSINALPGGRFRMPGSTRATNRAFTRPSTTPEPITPSAKQTPKPAPTSEPSPLPSPSPTPEPATPSLRVRQNSLIPSGGQILKERALLAKRTSGNITDLKKIYYDENTPLVTKIAAHQLLKKRNIDLPSPIPQASSPVQKNYKGGTILGLASGGTVGGPGRLGVDSIPAMIASGAKTMMGGANALLAPGEEVIRTSSAMLFRPLLKDINDNAGRLWQAFTNAVKKQNLNETIVTDLIDQFGKIIQEFKNLLDKESNELKRKNSRSKKKPGGGGIRPSFGGGNVIQKVDKGVGGLVQDFGGMIGRNRGKQTGLPGGGFIGEQLGRKEANDRYQDFTNSIRSLLDKSRSNISNPNINIQNPVNLTQNVVNPQIEKTILGEKNIYVIPVPISTQSSKLSSPKSSGGNFSVINLPPKVINLTKPSQPRPLPSSSSTNSLPSISPIDESNDYIFTTPAMYGILVV